MPSQEHVLYWLRSASAGAGGTIEPNSRWHTLGLGSHGQYLCEYRRNRNTRNQCYLCGQLFIGPGRRLHLIFVENGQRVHLHVHRDCIARGIAATLPSVSTRRASSVATAAAPIMIGADPELELQVHNYLVSAASIGLGVGGDATTSWRTTPVGADGAGGPIELHPVPGEPAVVFASIRDRLETLRSMLESRWPGLQSVEVVAGCGRTIPVGGHIHVSGAGLSPSRSLLDGLDALIGRPLYSVSDRRLRGEGCSYGRMSDYRRQSHGGFEYRTPPSWLAHPDLTAGAFAVARVLAGGDRDGHLGGMQDPSGVVFNAGEHRPVVEAFYARIDAMRVAHVTMEQCDVMTAWGLRPIGSQSGETGQPVLYSVAASGDTNCRQIASGLESRLPLRLAGARAGREAGTSYTCVVWLSPDLFSLYAARGLPMQWVGQPMQWVGQLIAEWTRSAAHNTIFLSAELRRNVAYSQEMLQRLIPMLEGQANAR